MTKPHFDGYTLGPWATSSLGDPCVFPIGVLRSQRSSISQSVSHADGVGCHGVGYHSVILEQMDFNVICMSWIVMVWEGGGNYGLGRWPETTSVESCRLISWAIPILWCRPHRRPKRNSKCLESLGTHGCCYSFGNSTAFAINAIYPLWIMLLMSYIRLFRRE